MPATGVVDRRSEHTGIRDQGDRPTCSAFAVTAGHEWLCGDSPDLSEEFALWLGKARDGLGGEASSTPAVLAGVVDEGQALELDWPYGIPAYPAPPPAAARDLLRRRQPQAWRRLDDSLDRLRKVILQGQQAVLLSLAFVPRAWARSTGGWIDADGSDVAVGNHAVCAVGLRESDTHRPWSVIVKNSWGSRWGDAGFGYISEQYLRRYPWRAYGLDAG